ncbi:hypothetical protein COR50_19345 [Chitinophaga caeni]|uniref:FAD-binding FR-type domain-containing protein n=2 Tax=Chitinophaga caeni TaxID=2029983 RepID=A0A291QYZ1_9BACT|nr:hypothetical protein COR50_19345 [Chitinophaga caeni]
MNREIIIFHFSIALHKKIMPSLAKWLGDTLESVMASKFIQVKLTGKELVAPAVVKLYFEGNLQGIPFHEGNAVAFRVNQIDYRNYTPSYWDDSGCEIIVHLHSNGPGSRFFEQIQPGAQLKMLIPRGRKMFDNSFATHTVIFDETGLGYATSVFEASSKNGQEFYAFGNVPGPVNNIRFPFNATNAKNGQYHLLEQDFQAFLDRYWIAAKQGAFYMVGNGKLVQITRNVLRSRGIQRQQLFTYTYWIEGRKGL